MAAIPSPGVVTGSFATRFLSDRYGRRSSVLASALPFIVGTVRTILVVEGGERVMTICNS